MREYIEHQTITEMSKYDSLRKATGLNYEGLYRKHTDAVREVDRATAEPGLGNQGYMLISPRLFAYLTDIALQHLALGAEMYGELREPSISKEDGFDELSRIEEDWDQWGPDPYG